MGRIERLASDWRVQAALGASALALALAAGVGLGRRSWHRPPAPAGPGTMPEAYPIADLWRAAAAGDVAAYLGCLMQPARSEAEARLERLGPEAFARELRAKAQAATAIEWGPPEPSPDGALRFPVTVTGADGARRATWVVARSGSHWRVREIVDCGVPETQGERK